MWITMIKAHCVIITAQVDIVCVTAVKEDESDYDNDERFIDLDGGWCQLLMLFWRSLSGHIIIFCSVFQM